MANRVVLELLGQSKQLTLGPLIRSAGIPVPCYPDLRGLLSHPKNLMVVAEECAQLLKEWREVNLIAGCSMGGIPLATALSIATGLPMVILRKRARSFAYSFIDGAYRRGQRAVLIDDSIITGNSQKSFAENLQTVRVKPVHVLTILDIGASPLWQKHREWFHDHDIPIHSLVTWTEWALYMRDRGRIPRRTVDTILHLMEHPPAWVREEAKSSRNNNKG